MALKGSDDITEVDPKPECVRVWWWP